MTIGVSGELYWIIASRAWSLESGDRQVLATGTRFPDEVAKMAARRGFSKAFLYLNNAAMGQGPISRYGYENVQRLKKISRQYDPDGVFQNLPKGGLMLRSYAVPDPRWRGLTGGHCRVTGR